MFARLEGVISGYGSVSFFVDQKPVVPQGFVATPDDTRVELKWVRNSEDDIDRYELFREGISQPYRVIPQPTLAECEYEGGVPILKMTDWTLTNGKKYRYRLEVIDSHGNRAESPWLEAIPVAGAEWGP